MADPVHPSSAGTPDAGERTHFMPTRSGEAAEEDEDQDLRRPPEPAPVIEHTWRNNPLLWVAVVVLVFLAVPLLVECSRNGRLERAAAKSAQAAASAAEAAPEVAEPAAPPSTEPQPQPSPGVVVTRPAGQPPHPGTEGPRQMITKCIERGRVVYTQTGDCTGSVTAVPIDADKNVVGTDRPGAKPP
jgi:hypothetical protein